MQKCTWDIRYCQDNISSYPARQLHKENLQYKFSRNMSLPFDMLTGHMQLFCFDNSVD